MPKIREFTPDTITHIRELHELSQQDFARKIGVGDATVPRWENGYFKPSRHVLDKLTKAAEEVGFEVELA